MELKLNESSSYGWNTDCEINFINTIGDTLTFKIDKYSLLTSYLIAANERVNWGKINKKRVISHAKRTLATL